MSGLSESPRVLLLAGAAGLIFEGDAEPLLLEPGSYVHIGAHVRDRVARTDQSVPTIWLTIHYQ
jgi:cupin 2 domain-containing protein